MVVGDQEWPCLPIGEQGEKNAVNNQRLRAGAHQFALSTASILAMASGAVLCSSAPAAESATVLEEVIVTARRVEEHGQDVPVSITTFSDDELQKRGVFEFRDITLSNPSVKINAGGAGTAISSTVAVRGNLQNDVSVVADPAVGTYIDGLIVSRTFGMNGYLVDLDNVQTLKGPQGTLFGRNTTGGALMIQTRNPELGELGGYVRAEAGSYDLRRVTGAVDVPLGQRAALRLVAEDVDRDSYADYTDGSTYGDESRSTYRAKLLFAPDDLTSVLLFVESVDVEASEAINTGTQPNDPQYDDIPSDIIPGVLPLLLGTQQSSAEANAFGVNVTRTLKAGELKFIAGRRELDVAIHTSLPPFLGHSIQDKPDNELTTAELVFTGEFMGQRLGVTSGLYYYDETTREAQRSFLDVFQPGLQTGRATPVTDSRSSSLFTQFNYSLTEDTRILVGGRYTRDDRQTKGDHGDLIGLTYESDEDEFDYLVSVDHRFTDDLLAYASMSSGYRAGFAAVSPAPDNLHWTALDPETVTNYELGIKSEWLDNTVRLNAAAYRQNYQDYQAAFILGSVRGYRNYDATLEGVELELTWSATEHLQLGGSYGHISAETDDGLALPNIPDTTYSVYVAQALVTPIGEVALRADYNWSDSWFSQIFSPELSTVDSLGLLNASATLTSGRWTVMAYARNVTDEAYFTYINEFDIGGDVYYDAGTLGMPRTLGVAVTYRF